MLDVFKFLILWFPFLTGQLVENKCHKVDKEVDAEVMSFCLNPQESGMEKLWHARETTIVYSHNYNYNYNERVLDRVWQLLRCQHYVEKIHYFERL